VKLELSVQVVAKYPNIKFHENPSSGSRVIPYGCMDGQTQVESNSRFSQL